MFSLSNNACSANNNSNLLPIHVHGAQLNVVTKKNPHVCNLLDHLRNESFQSHPWIVNNYITISKQFARKEIDLDQLVQHLGFKNAFVLLMQCYQNGNQCGESGNKLSKKTAHTIGILLQQLADSYYNKYQSLDFAKLEFCKDEIDPAFLQKLKGISSKKLINTFYLDFSKIALAALSLSAVAFAAWKMINYGAQQSADPSLKDPLDLIANEKSASSSATDHIDQESLKALCLNEEELEVLKNDLISSCNGSYDFHNFMSDELFKVSENCLSIYKQVFPNLEAIKTLDTQQSDFCSRLKALIEKNPEVVVVGNEVSESIDAMAQIPGSKLGVVNEQPPTVNASVPESEQGVANEQSPDVNALQQPASESEQGVAKEQSPGANAPHQPTSESEQGVANEQSPGVNALQQPASESEQGVANEQSPGVNAPQQPASESKQPVVAE